MSDRQIKREPDFRTADDKRREIFDAIHHAKRALNLKELLIRTDIAEHEIARLTRFHSWFFTEQTSDGPLISIATKTTR